MILPVKIDARATYSEPGKYLPKLFNQLEYLSPVQCLFIHMFLYGEYH